MKSFYFYLTIFILAIFILASPAYATEVLDPELHEEETQTESQSETLPQEESAVSSVDLTPLSDQMSLLNSKVDNLAAYIVPDFYKDYIRGILFNLSWSEDYLLVPKVIDGINHYYFYYGLLFDESGCLVLGSYPGYDFYSVDNVVYQEQKTLALDALPNIAYGSFAPYSSLYDSRFPVPTMEVVLIGLAVMFILFRKRVFT